jgi:hypothetical protein
MGVTKTRTLVWLVGWREYFIFDEATFPFYTDRISLE